MLYAVILHSEDSKNYIADCAREIALHQTDAHQILSLIHFGEVNVRFAEGRGRWLFDIFSDAGKFAASRNPQEVNTVFVDCGKSINHQADEIVKGIRKIELAKHPAPKMHSLLAWENQPGD
jgi:hypothetical protein